MYAWQCGDAICMLVLYATSGQLRGKRYESQQSYTWHVVTSSIIFLGSVRVKVVRR